MIKGLAERIHCVGSSGAGMLPLAICLAEAGHKVSAEDKSFSDEAKSLLGESGVDIVRNVLIDDSFAVVRSSAVSMDHPSVAHAIKAGASVLKRGECLARMVAGKRLVAIAGSHGKSTTAAMLVDLARSSGEEVSYFVGARYESGAAPGRWFNSEWVIAEIDESDGTIEEFEPELSFVLNADWDHHATYTSEEAYIDVYRKLIRRTKHRAIVIRDLEQHFSAESKKIDWIENPESSDQVSMDDWAALKGNDRTVNVRTSGEFNDTNARFALAGLKLMGFELKEDWIELSRLNRRQSCKYLSPELCVLEDYAHHPREIEAVINAARAARDSELIVVFQPHRYSRTAALKSELAQALKFADRLYLVDVYAAFEEPIDGGRIEDLARECDEANIIQPEEIGKELIVDDEEKRTILFLGAGKTDEYAKAFADTLRVKDDRWGSLFAELGDAAHLSVKLSRNETLASKTTLRVGGGAEMYFEPATLRELRVALRVCFEQRIPVSMLGRGSNLVVPDEGVEGLVIRLNGSYWRRIERLDSQRIRVGAGLRIKELCGAAARLGLEGFEFLEGIPGNVGGALRMNAGAMGGWTFDIVESVVFLKKDGTLVERKTEELEIGYRKCAELMDTVAIEVVLHSQSIEASQSNIRSKIDTYAKKRKESQPREPSAGCIFKNPEGDSAGRLIDGLGLKGTMVGGAAISETHGNFIINRGGATSSDVIELVRLARRVAKEKRGVELEPEVLLYGSRWEDVLS